MKDFTEIASMRTPIGRGFCVFIGTVASIYIATKGIQYIRKISEKKQNSLHPATTTTTCSICHKNYNNSVDGSGTLTNSSIVKCNSCSIIVCNSPKCAIWIQEQNHWKCSKCHQFDSTVYVQAYDWIFERLNRRFNERNDELTKCATFNDKPEHQQGNGDVMLELNGKSSPIPLEQRLRVREFIEDLISSMLGGSLDDVYVGQIYEHLQSDLPISENEQNPGASYENLRKIIHVIVQEVMRLPEFYNQKGFSAVDANEIKSAFAPKQYEDLLATAVLNKIVDTYNSDKKYENSSGIHSAGSDLDSCYNHDKSSSRFGINSRCSSTEPKSECSVSGFGCERSMSLKSADIIDQIFREKLEIEKQFAASTSPTASVHSGVSSDEAHLSDYLQSHKIGLPHLDIDGGSTDSEDIEQEFQSIYSASTGVEANNLSDNWLFKKRNANGDGTSSNVSVASPIGMLVPSPTEDIRTLIGDQNADEISDLSEAGSDLDSSDLDDELDANAIDIPHVLVECKTLIGGKNEMASFERSKSSLIDLLEPDSLVSEQSLTGQSPMISEAKNNLILIDLPQTRTNPNLMKDLSENNNRTRSANQEKFDVDNTLIDFDSLTPQNSESNDVEIVPEKSKNFLDFEPIPAPRNKLENEQKPLADEPINNTNSIEIDANAKSTCDSIAKALNICTFSALVAVEVATEPIVPLQIEDMVFSNLHKIDEKILSNTLETNVITSIDGESDGIHSNTEFNNLVESNKTLHNCAQTEPKTNEKFLKENNLITNNNADDNLLANNQNNSSITNPTIINNDKTKLTNKDDNSDEELKDLPGSIAEREHMKWKNAVELPNNPYSPEALQRRLSQSSGNKLNDFERFAGKCEASANHIESTTSKSYGKPLKVVLGSGKLDPVRYGRDYYINDAKASSGSRKQKSCADLSYHRSIDDDDNDHDNNVHSTNNNRNNGDANDNEDDSLLVEDITSSKEELIGNRKPSYDLVYNAQPIRVDENDPVLKKATKLEQLCTNERDYYLLESTTEEYNKFNFGDNLQPASLQQCDSISTTISDDSDSIRVYDLNKRETKILRHDIIKRSRNPIGDLNNTSTNRLIDVKVGSPLESTIQQFTGENFDRTKEIRKPQISPTKLKSVHLNRNPRKFKMADIELINDEISANASTKEVENVKTEPNDVNKVADVEQNENIDLVDEVLVASNETNVIESTENLLESERKHSEADAVVEKDTKLVYDIPVEIIEAADKNVESEPEENSVVTVELCTVVENGNGNGIIAEEVTTFTETTNNESHQLQPTIEEEIETPLDEIKEEIEIEAPLDEIKEEIEIEAPLDEIKERHTEFIITNGHTEKSVIEEDVISALPSVKELAKSFSANKVDESPASFQRPKMIWRKSFEGINSTDTSALDANENSERPSPDSFVPQFNHAYHPVAPGHSITARSLSTKFREELRNSTSANNVGRESPERPPSPVLVPGILQNNIAFFENLKNK